MVVARRTRRRRRGSGLAVATQGIREESGVKNVRPAKRRTFSSLEVLTVRRHVEAREVRLLAPASERHVLLIADDTDALTVKPDENSGVRWMDFDEALAASTEPWMRDRIYRKLVDKLAAVDLEMRR